MSVLRFEPYRDPFRELGSFTRQISLGEGLDSENLTAGYADGVTK